VPVLTPKVDIANARVRFKNGLHREPDGRAASAAIKSARFASSSASDTCRLTRPAREVEMYQLVPQAAGLAEDRRRQADGAR
jgi:hypothetical protein